MTKKAKEFTTTNVRSVQTLRTRLSSQPALEHGEQVQNSVQFDRLQLGAGEHRADEQLGVIDVFEQLAVAVVLHLNAVVNKSLFV